jgi:7,8-dihydropterin-6-yl-methyl-4-(beta-D-ribofuranosyl)aminobenzene 5'-phosphate synthase
MNLGCAGSVGRCWPGDGSVSSVTITILVDNTPGAGCRAAHGFASWIAADGKNLLYDTGPDPERLADNAKALGFDLSAIDAVVISHGHADHTGGLPAVVDAFRGQRLPVYLHPAALIPRWSLHHAVPKEIGMPAAALAAVRSDRCELHDVQGPTCISAGIWASGFIPRGGDDDVGGRFAWDQAGTHPDAIPDDQALIIETPAGAVVLTGCCHAGVANTLEWIRHQGEGRTIQALIGGLHLLQAEAKRIRECATYLRQHPIGRVAVGHCTGSESVVLTLGAKPIRCGWTWTC